MRRDYFQIFPLIAILVLFSSLCYGQAWTGILAPARATDWTSAGIPGGIPSSAWPNCTTTECNTLFGGTVTGSSITAALNSAPNNTVVRVPGGNFTLSGSTSTNRGNVVLRGAGPNSTTLTLNSNIYLGVSGSSNMGQYPDTLYSTNWTGGLTRGSRSLTLASTAHMVAGQHIVLDQHNAPWVYTTGIEGACTSGNSCGRNDSPLQFNGASSRAEPQMVEIQSVDSSTQITIKAPGVGFDHSSGLAPQAFYWNNRGTPGNNRYVGVEDIKINANSNDFAIAMPFCDFCWVKNVWVYNLARSAVFFWWGYGDEVRDSYFTSSLAGAPTQYGIEAIASTFTKIENNIFYNITASILPESSYGLVAGYNYANNNVAGNLFANFSAHLSHNSFQLLEGNIMNTFSYDNSWGSGSHSTLFRNRPWGTGTNKTNYREAVKFGAQNHYMNVVANVIGDPTYHTQYACDKANQPGSDVWEYDLGFWNSCVNGIDGNNPYDTAVESTLMRWGNWDAVTWKTNGNTNGVRYCTGSGAGNPACTSSETDSADSTFPGLGSPSTSFPASFYNGVTAAHASCGTGLSFWKNPADGSCPPYPPIGPDVACTTNCNANTANHVAIIPAQACYVNSPKDGKGYLTSFDGNACYASDTTGNPPPDPPTGVTAIPH
jgi:hypothetical protein